MLAAVNLAFLSLKKMLKHSLNFANQVLLRITYLNFAILANRTPDLGPILLKSCFMGGLKKELKYDVKLLCPNIVNDVIAIAV